MRMLLLFAMICACKSNHLMADPNSIQYAQRVGIDFDENLGSKFAVDQKMTIGNFFC